MGEQRTVCFALVALALAGPAAAGSAEFGTAQEAQAMLSRAIAEVKADRRGAIEKFNHNAPGFRDRDLFVFCFGAHDGIFTAHEGLVAHDVREVRDLAGEPVGEKIFAAARDGEVVRVSFMSRLPGTTHNVVKDAYVGRAGDQVCGVSVYRDAATVHGN
ncbi:MAG: chemotaxis protein [Alphaproteobacteria bacterium]